MILSISLLSKGHLRARNPNRLIAFRVDPGLSFSSSLDRSCDSSEEQWRSPSHKPCEVSSLLPFGLSRSRCAPWRVVCNLSSSPCSLWTSDLAFLTVEEYWKQRYATFAESSITAMMLAADPTASMASRSRMASCQAECRFVSLMQEVLPDAGYRRTVKRAVFDAFRWAARLGTRAACAASHVTVLVEASTKRK